MDVQYSYNSTQARTLNREIDIFQKNYEKATKMLKWLSDLEKSGKTEIKTTRSMITTLLVRNACSLVAKDDDLTQKARVLYHSLALNSIPSLKGKIFSKNFTDYVSLKGNSWKKEDISNFGEEEKKIFWIFL